MKLKNIVFCVLNIISMMTLKPNAEVVSWLKGTYAPFETGTLVAHQGLSPLMGAIAWHSQWIAGLYTWGPGKKEVIAAEPVAAGQAPARERYKWSGGDYTAQLVRVLFHEAGPDDIQPIISEHEPLVWIVKHDARGDEDPLKLFFDGICGNAVAQEQLAQLMSATMRRKLKKLFELIDESRFECGVGRAYPAHVTDQIISAYYYAVQFKDEVRGAEPVVLFMQQALQRYMRAFGVAGYMPEQYSKEDLISTAQPSVIDEAVLVKTLYTNIAHVYVPPLAQYTHFDYRGAPDIGNCAETAILNLLNVLLYDPERQVYTLDLLPGNVRAHISEQLKSFYENPINQLVSKTGDAGVITAWLEAISGLSDAVGEREAQLNQTLAKSHIVYRSCNKRSDHAKESLFELAGDPTNVRLVFNYLLGLQARSFDELAGMLSTDHRVIKMNMQDQKIVNVFINDKPTICLSMEHGHAKASLLKHDWVIAGYAEAEKTATPLVRLQHRLLMRHADDLFLQKARYLLYGAGVRDEDWLVPAFKVWCAAAITPKKPGFLWGVYNNQCGMELLHPAVCYSQNGAVLWLFLLLFQKRCCANTMN